MRALVLFAAVVTASGSLGAQHTAAPAAGTFTSKDVAFDVAGAVAFNGPSSLDKAEPAILVVVSNTGLNGDALADFVDRKLAVEKLIKDDKTAVVYLEFTPQGRYRGLSYYFGSGNGCGFCTSEVTSTVKLSNGRLAGKLKGTEKGRPFDLTLDVAVLADAHGSALPADGGAPGKAYLAYHAALVKHDAKALKPTLSPGRIEVWDRANTKGDLSGYVSYLAEDHPMKSVKVVKGWATADKASLVIEGVGEAGNLAGEVLLVNTKGAWGVDEELVDVVIGK
jgi:hypothetical protein